MCVHLYHLRLAICVRKCYKPEMLKIRKYNNNNGPNGHLFYVMRRGMLPIIMLPDGDLRIALHLVLFWILTIWGSVRKYKSAWNHSPYSHDAVVPPHRMLILGVALTVKSLPSQERRYGCPLWAWRRETPGMSPSPHGDTAISSDQPINSD